MATNYVSKTATMTKRVPRERIVTPELLVSARLFLVNGQIKKGKNLKDLTKDKIVEAPEDTDGNVLLTAKTLWDALPVTMAQARGILERLITDGDVVTESARYKELHGEA